MKTIYLTSYWMMLFCSVTGQAVQSPKQDQRYDLLKRMWKVGLTELHPGVPQLPSRTAGYKFSFPDKAISISKRRLEDKARNAIMVLTMIGCIDSVATDSVQIEFYGASGSDTLLNKRYGLATVLAKYKGTAEMVSGLFDLCPYSYRLHQYKNAIEATISPTVDIYAPTSDCGYIGLSYSLIITKFFDRMQGIIHDVKWTWSDSFGHQIYQAFSVTDNSYLALESSFL